MDIDNVVWIGCQHILRHKPKEPCKNYPIGLLFMQVLQDRTVFIEVFPSKISCLYAKILGTLSNICITHIIDNACNLDICSISKILTDLLRIGSVARPQDSQSYCSVHYYSTFGFTLQRYK